MNSYKLMGLMEILRNSLKISEKVMLSIASFTLLQITLFFLSYNFYFKPSMSYLLFKQTLLQELRVGFKEYLRTVMGVELIFSLACFIVSLFSNTATILLSAKSLSVKKLSFKDLLLGVVGSWKRLFITSFPTALLRFVYIIFVSATLIISVFLIIDRLLASIAMFFVLRILASILYRSLLIYCLVFSVIDFSDRRELFGKAGRLLKGHRLHVFALSFLYMPIFIAVFHILMMVQGKQSPGDQIVSGLFSRIWFCLLTMIELISYTVIFSPCKKTHGEEIEKQRIA